MRFFADTYGTWTPCTTTIFPAKVKKWNVGVYRPLIAGEQRLLLYKRLCFTIAALAASKS